MLKQDNGYCSKEELYRTNTFIIKTNRKGSPSIGDNEYESQDMCYNYLRSYRNAIDVGARFGGWTRQMGQKFKFVYAFEPREKWQIVFNLNIDLNNVKLFPYGLGASNHFATMLGNRIINKSESGVEIRTLDEFKLTDIDFIKIDTDGYELEVLQGGLQTILANKPMICLECLPGPPYFGEKALEFLLGLGAKELAMTGQNKLLSW